MTDQFYDDEDHERVSSERHMDSIFLLVTKLADLPELMDKETKDILFQLIRRDRRDERGSLLHISINNAFFTWRLSTLVLLLKSGADPNAGDSKGNGPLHVVAMACKLFRVLADSITHLLLDHNAHLDRVNDEGKTAADLWMKYNNGAFNCELPSWYHSEPHLMCIAAKVIRSHQIDYSHLPSIIHTFITMH